MALPFLLGVIAIICAMVTQRRAAIGVWVLLVIVLLAWLRYHATDPLDLSFQGRVLARLLNILGLAGVSLVLLVAFFYQLVLGELPCPLCLLQRGAFVALGMGFLLNIRFGSSTAHYGIVLISAVIGAATSSRQMLLHFKPGDTGFGSAPLGLHFYTWGLVAFMAYVVYTGILLFIETGDRREENAIQDGLGRAALWLFLLVVAGNLVSTLLECGVGPCADNPTTYFWLQG